MIYILEQPWTFSFIQWPLYFPKKSTQKNCHYPVHVSTVPNTGLLFSQCLMSILLCLSVSPAKSQAFWGSEVCHIWNSRGFKHTGLGGDISSMCVCWEWGFIGEDVLFPLCHFTNTSFVSIWIHEADDRASFTGLLSVLLFSACSPWLFLPIWLFFPGSPEIPFRMLGEMPLKTYVRSMTRVHRQEW